MTHTNTDTLLSPPADALPDVVALQLDPFDDAPPGVFVTRPSERRSWGRRAVWLAYVPPHPDPTVEGDPFDDM